MEKKTFNKKWMILVILIAIAAIFASGYWYFQFKIPHAEAVVAYNSAVKIVKDKNAELDKSIDPAQKLLNKNELALDSAKATDLQTAISAANESKRSVKEMPKKVEDIKRVTQDMGQPLDYSNNISIIAEKQKALEDSIKQMQQIINPSGDFVVQRLSETNVATDIQGVTEDNDPNGNLNKQGGYTSTTYFSNSLINQNEVYGDTIIAKGTEGGGCVEVYTNASDAETRNAYLSDFDGAGFLNSGSHYVYGTVVIRTSSKLTATQQNEVTESIKNKLIELK